MFLYYASDRKSLTLAIFMDFFFFFLHTLGTVLEQACYHKTMIANKHTLSVELKLYHRTHRLGTSRAEMIHVAGDKTDESNCAIQL